LEDHHRERAGQLILAEVEKMNSFISNSYFQDLGAWPGALLKFTAP
jgi:hypothetical protein